MKTSFLGLCVAAALCCEPVLHAQNSKIAFSSDVGGNADILLINPDGSDLTQVTHNPSLDYSPIISRDGTKIVFLSHRAGNEKRELYMMRADGSDVVRLTDNGEDDPSQNEIPPYSVGPQSPAFHPDGNSVIFSQGGELYTIPLIPLVAPTPIVFDASAGITVKEEPVYSPDGTKIAFSAWTETETEPESGLFELNSDIFIANPDGSDVKRLTTHPGWDTEPAFSPDGSKIVFVKTDHPERGVYVMDVAGGLATLVYTDQELTHTLPDFTPDGSSIVFSATGSDYKTEIFTIHLDGSNLASLTRRAISELNFFGIGFLPDGGNSQAFGISNDGKVVVGTAENIDFNQRAVRWVRGEGLAEIGVLNGGEYSEGAAISGDGSILVGGSDNVDGQQRAFRWSAALGLEQIGTITGQINGAGFATGVSDDGKTMVGWSLDENGQEQPIRWTRIGGVQNLGTFGGGRGFAYDANADGSVIVGAARDQNETSRAFKWTSQSGLVQLSSENGFSEAVAITLDARVIAGNNDAGAFRWTQQEGLVAIPHSTGFESSSAAGISADGTRIAGSLWTEGFIEVAGLWTSESGWIDLNKSFASEIPRGWILQEATAISADGQWVAGNAENPEGFREGFVLHVDMSRVQPTFSNILVTSQNELTLQSSAIAGQDYLLETSTDLINWTPGPTVRANNPSITFGANQSSPGQEFFRLRRVNSQ